MAQYIKNTRGCCKQWLWKTVSSTCVKRTTLLSTH